MTPAAEITVNGQPVASIFNQRLISVLITDKEGLSSDEISCELSDGAPFLAIPRKGDVIAVSLGYRETGLAPFGSYTAEDPVVECLPYKMTVSGKAASMRGGLKQKKTRHWDGKSVKDIVTEIAAGNGVAPMISQAVAAHVYPWFGQMDESDLHVLERLARRHGALVSVKDGKLVFAEKGAGLSVSGLGLSAVTATPANILVGTCRTTFDHRAKVKSVKAHAEDPAAAKRLEIEETSDDEGEADYVLPEPYADEAEAKAAAKSKAKALKSETIRTSVTLYGDPSVRAGAPFVYSGVRPELDGLPFIIESARHELSKSGYTVDVECKLKPEVGT